MNNSDVSRGTLPTDFIEQVKDGTNLIELIGRDVKIPKSNGTVATICCTFHADKSPSMRIDNEKQFYHCFGCGEHGDCFDYLMKTKGLGFNDAVRSLAEHLDIPVPVLANAKPPSPELIAILKRKADCHEFLEKAYINLISQEDKTQFLESKGVGIELIQKYQLGFQEKGSDGMSGPGIFFPIIEKKGRPQGYYAMPVSKMASPGSSEFIDGVTLFGLSELTIQNDSKLGRSIYLLPNPIELIRSKSMGVNNAVSCTIGMPTELDFQLLSKKIGSGKVIVFINDNEHKNNVILEVASRSSKFLSSEFHLKFFMIPKGETAASYIYKNGALFNNEVEKKSLFLSEAFTSALSNTFDLSVRGNLEHVKNIVSAFLNSISDKFYAVTIKKSINDELELFSSLFEVDPLTVAAPEPEPIDKVEPVIPDDVYQHLSVCLLVNPDLCRYSEPVYSKASVEESRGVDHSSARRGFINLYKMASNDPGFDSNSEEASSYFNHILNISSQYEQDSTSIAVVSWLTYNYTNDWVRAGMNKISHLAKNIGSTAPLDVGVSYKDLLKLAKINNENFQKMDNEKASALQFPLVGLKRSPGISL